MPCCIERNARAASTWTPGMSSYLVHRWVLSFHYWSPGLPLQDISYVSSCEVRIWRKTLSVGGQWLVSEWG